MKNNKMITSNPSEVFTMINTMSRNAVACSLELMTPNDVDPVIAVTSQPVTAELSADELTVSFGETVLSFPVKDTTFSRHTSENQISLCIGTGHITAWFYSDALPPDAIVEAKQLDEDNPASKSSSAHRVQGKYRGAKLKRFELERVFFKKGMLPHEIKLLDAVEAALEQAYETGQDAVANPLGAAWSNNSALGYGILAAKRLGLGDKLIQQLVRAMYSEFDRTSVEEAKQVYNKSPF